MILILFKGSDLKYVCISVTRVVIHVSTGLLIFRAGAEPRISSKSAKSHEIHKNAQNPAKFARNLTKYMSAQHIWKLSWLLGLLILAVSLLIYLETSSLQRVNNSPKLPGVLRLMLRKTGKQRCKHPGVPNVDHGNWGWECDSLFYRVFYHSPWRMLCFVKDHALYIYVHLTYKDDDLFRNGSVREW